MKPVLVLLALLTAAVAAPPTNTLLENRPLAGSTKTTRWTYINFVNPNFVTDVPATMTGTMSVAKPGYGASDGLYSYTGPYSVTNSLATNNFDIQHAVLQFDLVWDPATAFPSGAGPKLNYNNGNQQLSPKPMIIGRTRTSANNTGIPEMAHLDSFVYRGVTFQWDLSAIEEDVHSVRIVMPLANHTSLVGAQIDVASEYQQIGGTTLTPLQIWRDTYFNSTANTGNGADLNDFDNDGMSNLIEYALGTRPEDTDGEQGRASLPKLSIVANRPRLSFKIPSAPPSDLTYRVEATSDFVTWKVLASKQGAAAWTWLGTGASQIVTETSIERQPVHVSDETTISPNTRRFLRLRVTY